MRICFCALLACVLVQSSFAETPKLAEAINLEAVNSTADDTDPYVDPTGKLLAFSSNRGGTFDILYTQRRSRTFSKPRLLEKAASRDADERSPSIFYRRGENPQIYFATNKVRDEKFKDLKNFDIQFLVSTRAPLDLVGLSKREDEMHPCVVSGGKEFFFSRKLDNGWTLFVAKGPALGPVGGGKEVGFEPGFCNASLTNKADVMYLQGKMDDGRSGIYVSRRMRGKWSTPKLITNLVDPKAKLGAMTPWISGSGRTLYFASDRPGGKGKLDLWAVPTKDLTTAEK